MLQQEGIRDMISGLSGKISLSRDKFQMLQDHFCAACHVYVICVDRNGVPFTSISGNREEWERIKPYVDESQCIAMAARLESSDIEEQIEEDTADRSIRMAGIKLDNDGISHLFLIVIGVIGGFEGLSFTTQREDFSHTVDTIREFSVHMISAYYIEAEKSAALKRSEEVTRKLQISLNQSSAMTEIVQLLETDDDLKTVSESIMKETMHAIEFSNACLIRVIEPERALIVANVQKTGEKPLFGGALNIAVPEFIGYVSRLTVVSAAAEIPADMNRALEIYGIESAVIIPVPVSRKEGWYVIFADCRCQRHWDIPEIKYFNDVAKILHDVILKDIQKNSIESSSIALEEVLDNVDCGIFVCSVEESAGEGAGHAVLFANRMFKQAFSKELKSHVYMIEDTLKQCIIHGAELFHESDARWYDVSSSTLKWTDGRDVNIYTIYDITEKKDYRDRIEQQAKRDFLTGLYNRMCAEKDLACYIAECSKKGTKGALLYLDLDDFKHINDGLGHKYGDVLLKAIAHSFQRVKGIENTCYRMGGDEFVIIVPDTEYDELDRITGDIRDIFMKPWFLRGADYYCTMSVGLVTFPTEGNSVLELIKKADIAMYQAKHLGKNRIATFEVEADSKAVKRLDMEKNMRMATSPDSDFSEFEIYYQPLVDITEEGDPCVGAEALVRWNSKELGFISPADFIPLAEYLGLITSIGEYVLRRACAECRYWNDNGYPRYKVNVNLSVVQLLQENIVDIISKAINDTGINPSNLTLEVTESLAINDMAKMKEVLAKIRTLGCRIALDDFGTGYSSLNHIREIPFDVIKVDQSFVKDIATNHYSQSFVKMVNELAEAIGVRVCVEGIETEAQYEIVKKIHANMIQGYYFDRPMPQKAFEHKYIEHSEYIE